MAEDGVVIEGFSRSADEVSVEEGSDGVVDVVLDEVVDFCVFVPLQPGGHVKEVTDLYVCFLACGQGREVVGEGVAEVVEVAVFYGFASHGGGEVFGDGAEVEEGVGVFAVVVALGYEAVIFDDKEGEEVVVGCGEVKGFVDGVGLQALAFWCGGLPIGVEREWVSVVVFVAGGEDE